MDSFRGVNPSPGNLQVVYKCPSALSTPIGYNRLPMNRIILTAAAWSLLFPSGLLRAQTPPRAFALQAESPRFWDLFDRGAALEKVAGGFGFLEGPVWEHRGRFLYVSDETLNKISRVYPDGRTETVLEIGDPDGSTLDRSRHLITTASVLRAIVEVQPDGKYRVLADKYDGKRFNSPNDVVLGPDGALYFTDPTLDLPKGEKQEIPFQGVYRLGSDGSVRLLIRDLTAPNGLAFSPDGKRLYVDDTRTREIHVYDVADNGEVNQGRLFGKEEDPPRSGVPDGMKVDLKGNLYVTGPLGILGVGSGRQSSGNHRASRVRGQPCLGR